MPENGLPHITKREREVLECLAKGFSTEGVSLRLGITFNTVESHRKSLLRKFNSKNTAQMIAISSRLFPGGVE